MDTSTTEEFEWRCTCGMSGLGPTEDSADSRGALHLTNHHAKHTVTVRPCLVYWSGSPATTP